MKRPLVTLMILLNIGWWGWVGVRVLAYNSGRLGAVTFQWMNFQEPHQILTVSPQPNDSVVTISPGATYQIYLKPQFHFGQVQYALHADAPLTMTPRLRSGTAPSTTKGSIRVVLADAVLQHGVYVVEVTNPGSAPVHLRWVTVTLIP